VDRKTTKDGENVMMKNVMDILARKLKETMETTL
jgi:hypothetical protein